MLVAPSGSASLEQQAVKLLLDFVKALLRFMQHEAGAGDGVEVHAAVGVLVEVSHGHQRPGDGSALVAERHRADIAVLLREGDAAGFAVCEAAGEFLSACHRIGGFVSVGVSN